VRNVIAIGALGAAGLVLAAGCSASGRSAPSQPAEPARSGVVVLCTDPVFGCRSPDNGPTAGYMQAQPYDLTLSGDGTLGISQLTWTGWGSPVATGTGRIGSNDCTPDCASGHNTYAAVRVTVSDLRPYQNGQAYAETALSPAGPIQLSTYSYSNLVP
jgi:hypothetical protein